MPVPVRRAATRHALLAVLMVVAAAMAEPVSAQRQMPAQLDPDPDMPMKVGFDTDRAIFWANPNFDPFREQNWQPIGDVLGGDDVSEDTPVLVFEAGGKKLVFVSSHMAYHHVAQGEMEGEPWMVTF